METNVYVRVEMEKTELFCPVVRRKCASCLRKWGWKARVREVLTKDEKLCAMSWKSAELGISYGRLVSGLTDNQIAEIYVAYENLMKQRRATEAKRLAEYESSQKRRKRGVEEAEIFPEE